MPLSFRQTFTPVQIRATERCVAGVVLIFFCVLFSGCQRWPGSQQARQFQIDSDRLLGEFRAQKKRADELASKNQLLEERLAESEKVLAKQNLAVNRGKSSSSGGSGSRLMIGESLESDGLLSRNNTSRSRSTSGASRFQDFERRGLPDRTTSTSGVMTSSREERDLVGDPDRSPQWRPINKR